MRIKTTKIIVLEKYEEDSFDDNIIPIGTLATVLSENEWDYWVELDDKTFLETMIFVDKNEAEVINE